MYKILFEANPQHDDVQVLSNGIMENARIKMGHSPIEFFAFFIRDENNEILGGCNGDPAFSLK